MAKAKITITNIVLSIALIISVLLCIKLVYDNKHVDSDRAEQVYVYVTKTGSCYHDDNCYHLRYSKIEISLDEAVKEYRRCSSCKPPVIKKEK